MVAGALCQTQLQLPVLPSGITEGRTERIRGGQEINDIPLPYLTHFNHWRQWFDFTVKGLQTMRLKLVDIYENGTYRWTTTMHWNCHRQLCLQIRWLTPASADVLRRILWVERQTRYSRSAVQYSTSRFTKQLTHTAKKRKSRRLKSHKVQKWNRLQWVVAGSANLTHASLQVDAAEMI